MSTVPFDAVLCDIDGVLRLWDPDGMSAVDREYGLAAGTLAAAAFREERLGPAVRGAVTDEEWRAAVAEDLAEACGSLAKAKAVVAGWETQEGRVDGEVLSLLIAARQYVPVVLVSNATTRLEADLARLGVVDAFDGIVNSSRVGAAKPDEVVFRIAAERAGVAASRCLFVDDTLGNVTAAGAVGMTGLHYRRVEQLVEVLALPGRG